MKLTEEESSLFYRLFLSLLDYTNKKYDINDEMDIMECVINNIGLYPMDLMEIATIVWDNTSVIDEFIEDAETTQEEVEILLSWKKRIRSTFIVERHLKKGTILIDPETQDVYLVQGIISSWEEMIPYTPTMTNATLIPFKDKIISDGLLNTYPIRFGSGVKSSMKHTYLNAKSNDLIIKTID